MLAMQLTQNLEQNIYGLCVMRRLYYYFLFIKCLNSTNYVHQVWDQYSHAMEAIS